MLIKDPTENVFVQFFHFLHFHVVFSEIWPNNRLAHSSLGLEPLVWEILDPPLMSLFTNGNLPGMPERL